MGTKMTMHIDWIPIDELDPNDLNSNIYGYSKGNIYTGQLIKLSSGAVYIVVADKDFRLITHYAKMDMVF